MHTMRRLLGLLTFGLACAATGALLAQDSGPEPTCPMCPAEYIAADEIGAYVRKAIAERRVDQQIRDVTIGKAHVGIGLVHRTRLDTPQPDSVAEHDLVSEVYYVMEGAATLVTGPRLVDARRRPADLETVRLFNGPGRNAASIAGGETHTLSAGDVIVIPAGTGHWFTRIDDHITYVMVRIDPDKVTPLKDAAASRAYLQAPRR